MASLTCREKRCQDCACLIKKNGKMCCDELWGRPCNDIAADECPEEVTLEEVEEIIEKTEKVKIDHGVSVEKKTEKKKRTVVISDEKHALFEHILSNLHEFSENVEVLKENKLICVKIGDKNFKIDIIEQRKPKS